MPGAFTPTEVETAWQAGASLVKLYPCSLGGPDYVRSVRGPLARVPCSSQGDGRERVRLPGGGRGRGRRRLGRALAVWDAVEVGA